MARGEDRGGPTDVSAILAELKAAGSEENRAGMKRFGINVAHAYGVPIAFTRPLARRLGRDQALSLALWDTGVHEARILAALVGEPDKVTPDQCDAWVAAFDSWDLCDQVCAFFARTALVDRKIVQYAEDPREFVRRAAFALIAERTVHDKRASDDAFLPYLALIETAAMDPRNFVKKAVNWALRQIGKRSLALHGPALAIAERLAAAPDRTARWIGRDAVRELTAEKILARIAARTMPRG